MNLEPSRPIRRPDTLVAEEILPDSVAAREFTSAHARTLHALDRALVRAHGVTACELDVLQRIAATESGSLRIQDLSELVLRSQSTLSWMVGRLEAEGLLVRTTYAKDRRGTLATFTPEGRVRLNDAQSTAVRSSRH